LISLQLPPPELLLDEVLLDEELDELLLELLEEELLELDVELEDDDELPPDTVTWKFWVLCVPQLLV
jgi:hypothetical protein